MTTSSTDVTTRAAVPLTAGLLVTLAINSAIAPFATDTYTPAFPQVTDALGTTAGVLGLTLTTFFIGMAAGQLFGGPLSDQRGRRTPLIVGGLLCTVGAVVCALAPSVGVLIVARIVQGFGGGMAAAVARSVLVDIVRGAELARALSLMMTLVGLSPMIAPMLGAGVLSLGGTWREIFWCLVVLGGVMSASAAFVVRETLPVAERHRGGAGAIVRGFREVLRDRVVVGYLLVATGSATALISYVANAAYVLEGINGIPPLAYGIFFASTALAQVAVSIVNARIVRRFGPRPLLRVGLAVSVAAVIELTVSVLLLGTPLIPVAAGFLVLMAVQGLTFGNAGALASSRATRNRGATSALVGLTQAVAGAVAAPLASLGGVSTAAPMVLVMLVGIALAAIAFAVLTRAPAALRPADPGAPTAAA